MYLEILKKAALIIVGLRNKIEVIALTVVVNDRDSI